jgi:O-antigen ligase
VLAAVFAKPVFERLTESNEGNLGVRFELNRIALSMVAAHPLAGVGLSNFIPVMDRYDPTDVMRRFPATVHNLYLLEAAEAGIPGALLFVAMFGAVVTIGLRRLHSIADEGSKWVAAAILAGLIGFLVTQLADFSHRLEPLRSLLWTNVGLLFALCARAATRPLPKVHDRE